MSALPKAASSNGSDRWHAMGAGFLGWTLDAFDFFVVIFLLDTLAEHFHVPKRDIVLSVTATLAMRPVGALLFGMMADRYGRRRPLMANVCSSRRSSCFAALRPTTRCSSFCACCLASAWAASGAWVRRWPWSTRRCAGAACSPEFCRAATPSDTCWRRWPRAWCCPIWGWRAMFWVGGIPALLALYIRTKVPESEAWQQHRVARTIDGPRIAWQNKWLSLYMIAADVPHELPLARHAGPLSRLP